MVTGHKHLPNCKSKGIRTWFWEGSWSCSWEQVPCRKRKWPLPTASSHKQLPLHLLTKERGFLQISAHRSKSTVHVPQPETHADLAAIWGLQIRDATAPDSASGFAALRVGLR